MKPFFRSTLILSAALLATAAMADPPANAPSNKQPSNQPNGGRQMANRVGGELYGNNGGTAPNYYPHQVLLLPSEERYAIERSGALPSEIRAEANAIGPLAPFGRGTYIPGQSALQRAVHARSPVLYGPAYGPQPQVPDNGPRAPAPLPELPGNVPARSGDGIPPPQYVAPQAITAGHMIDRRVSPGSRVGESITYYKLPVRATTAPATQPSLAD